MYILYVFFSLQRSGDHHYLLSFPTRRSSDLHWCPQGRTRGYERAIKVIWVHAIQFAKLSQPSCVAGRSEEHTSELQSRGHLVCRLLLEKKKISIPTTKEM